MVGASSPLSTILPKMTAPDLIADSRVCAEIARVERTRPAPIPVAAGITDGAYRFTPDGPGDEPALGKGVKQEAIEGQFPISRTRPLSSAAIVLSDSRRRE
jgi:hypothetical protein